MRIRGYDLTKRTHMTGTHDEHLRRTFMADIYGGHSLASGGGTSVRNRAERCVRDLESMLCRRHREHGGWHLGALLRPLESRVKPTGSSNDLNCEFQ